MATGSVVHSVHPFGMGTVKPAPDFDSLSKPTTSVDVGCLQTELRALHNRLTLLETLTAATMKQKEDRLDEDSKNSGEETVQIAQTSSNDEGEGVYRTGSNVDDPTAAAAGPGGAPSGQSSASPIAGRNEAGAIAALKPDKVALTELVESGATAAKCRNKAQSPKEKAAALARSMEICQLQLAIEARVTSEDLAQATNANTDKIVALQSSFDFAISDSFRRMQNMVNSQVAGLLQTIQKLVQDQSQCCRKGTDNISVPRTGSSCFCTDILSDDAEGSDERQAFVKVVTEVVQRVMKEAETYRATRVDSANFDALKEDYEIFKEYMEEKVDRQDAMAMSLDDLEARVKDAEATISVITDNMESSAKEMEEAMELVERKKGELEKIAQEASSLAAEAKGECTTTRALVGDTKREGLLDARREAEAIIARFEGRAKANAQNMRGEARTATEKVMKELKRHMTRAADEMEEQNKAISRVKSLSDEAMSSAVAGLALATEVGASLQRAEEHFGKSLDEATDKQAVVVEGLNERIVVDEGELSKLKEELKGFVRTNGVEIGGLREDLAKAEASAETATGILRADVKDALKAMLLDQDLGSKGAKNRRSSTGGGTSSIIYSGGDIAWESRILVDSRGGGLLSLGLALRRQGDDTVQNVVTLQRSSVGIVTMLRKVQAGLQVLSTKDLFWKRVDIKLEAHQRAVENICLDVEDSTVIRRSRITLSKEAQACLAGDMLRVAKLIAVKADYEVIRDLAKLEGPEQTGQEWDERVGYLRQIYMQRFVQACRDGLDKRAPELRTNFKGEEIRRKFLNKLSDALKVALSKYSPTTPGETLFGKIKLKAKACVACDRPFIPSAAGWTGLTPTGGISGAAVKPQSLPEENSHITKDSFWPKNSSGRLGSPSRQGSSIDTFELEHSPIHSVVNGDRSSAGSPHVFRGGFKLPKHLKSPLQAIEVEDQGALVTCHTSPLLHKSPLISGLHHVPKDVRPRTSGIILDKWRSLIMSNPLNHQGLYVLHDSENRGTTSTDATRHTRSSGGKIASRSKKYCEEGKNTGPTGEGGDEETERVLQRDNDTTSTDARGGQEASSVSSTPSIPYNETLLPTRAEA